MTESLREKRRREKDELSRAHILDAAGRVFGQKGYHAATLKEVAEEAEFSVGALYGFFESKGDLFTQVMVREGRGLVDAQRTALADAAGPIDGLHRIVDSQVAYFRDRPDFFRMFQREFGGVGGPSRGRLDPESLDVYEAAMGLEAETFGAGVAAGEFRGGDPRVMAALFSGLMQAYIAQMVVSIDDSGEPRVEASYPLSELHDLVDRAFLA